MLVSYCVYLLRLYTIALKKHLGYKCEVISYIIDCSFIDNRVYSRNAGVEH